MIRKHTSKILNIKSMSWILYPLLCILLSGVKADSTQEDAIYPGEPVSSVSLLSYPDYNEPSSYDYPGLGRYGRWGGY